MSAPSPTRRPLRAVALAYIDAAIVQRRAERADLVRQIAQRRAERDELRRQIRWLLEERARIVADEGRP